MNKNRAYNAPFGDGINSCTFVFNSQEPQEGVTERPRGQLNKIHWDVQGLSSLGSSQETTPAAVLLTWRRIHSPTCSLVVLPLATSTIWKPVSPATGMKNSPATHITARLRCGVKDYKVEYKVALERAVCPQTSTKQPPALNIQIQISVNHRNYFLCERCFSMQGTTTS